MALLAEALLAARWLGPESVVHVADACDLACVG
jgi:hypothetical protein